MKSTINEVWKPLVSLCAAGALSFSCGADDANEMRGDTEQVRADEDPDERVPQWVQDRNAALDASTLDRAGARCESAGAGEALIDEPLSNEELLLLDVAPTCDLERLGVAEEQDPDDGLVIERSSIVDTGTFALCACTELEASNRIEAPGQSDIVGDIGVNEHALGSAPFRIDGVFVSGGAARFDNLLQVNELRVDGVLTAANEIDIDGDAVVGGLDIPGERVNVGGTLTVPEGTDLSSVESTNDVVTADVDVEAPCDCSLNIDYDELRAEFRDVDGDGDDDYEGFGWDDDDYEGFDWDESTDDERQHIYPTPPFLLHDLEEEHVVHLGCGSYYLDTIDSAAPLTIVAVGDVAIFVDGDVTVSGPLVLKTTDDGSLELYVAGAFRPTNSVDIGIEAEPDAVRLYVRDEMRLAGPTSLHGTVYAPGAPFIADNTLTSDGAIFAHRLDFAGPVEITDGPRFSGDGCLVWDEADANVSRAAESE